MEGKRSEPILSQQNSSYDEYKPRANALTETPRSARVRISWGIPWADVRTAGLTTKRHCV